MYHNYSNSFDSHSIIISVNFIVINGTFVCCHLAQWKQSMLMLIAIFCYIKELTECGGVSLLLVRNPILKSLKHFCSNYDN